MESPAESARLKSPESSRREILKWGAAVGGAELSRSILSAAYAGEDNTIRLALIGCGGRGSGAVGDALSTTCGPVKLHAMADIADTKLSISHKALARRFGDKVDVSEDRKFLGFDAYRKAMDSLKPGDIAMCTTHAYCRPLHVEYAVGRGLHVFMEKSFAPDPAGLRRILHAGEQAKKKNLKIAAGLMCRHSPNRQALIEKINAGELGDVQLVRAYRMDAGGRLSPRDRQANPNELEYQLRRPGHFHWASSGRLIDYMIHQIDECCWLMNGWPVEAQGLGGIEADRKDCSQNLASYAIEYTFANGGKAMVNYRGMPKCKSDFATYVTGTKRSAQFSGNVHRGDVHLYQDHRCAADNILWKAPDERDTPWQAEWHVLMEKIRRDEPHNEAERAAASNYAALMGRAAVHTGQVVTHHQITRSAFGFLPSDIASWNDPAPIHDDAEGRYPLPIPGQWSEL